MRVLSDISRVFCTSYTRFHVSIVFYDSCFPLDIDPNKKRKKKVAVMMMHPQYILKIEN